MGGGGGVGGKAGFFVLVGVGLGQVLLGLQQGRLKKKLIHRCEYYIHSKFFLRPSMKFRKQILMKAYFQLE